jgi:hypothetical protein
VSGQRVQTDLRAISPQLSFNFGSGDGWSYLSAGLGVADVVTQTTGPAGRRDTPWLQAINFGGGARWFLKSHFAVGFDLRFRRIASGAAGPIELEGSPPTADNGDGGSPESPPASTPSMMVFSFNVGLSFR